jgi:hypothetical protein
MKKDCSKCLSRLSSPNRQVHLEVIYKAFIGNILELRMGSFIFIAARDLLRMKECIAGVCCGRRHLRGADNAPIQRFRIKSDLARALAIEVNARDRRICLLASIDKGVGEEAVVGK